MRWLQSRPFMIVDSSGRIAPETITIMGGWKGLAGGSHGYCGGRAWSSEAVSTSCGRGGVLEEEIVAGGGWMRGEDGGVGGEVTDGDQGLADAGEGFAAFVRE